MILFKARTPNGEIINSALSPFTFPAGEAHVKREERRDLEPVEIAVVLPSPESLHTDLFLLAMWDDYVCRAEPEPARALIMPYVPGARADRGEPFGVGIYSHFIDELALDFVAVYDPHSPVSEGLLKEAVWGMDDLVVLRPADVLPKALPRDAYDFVIAPDKGAVGRASSVADALGIPVVRGEKTRDFATGRLTGYSLPKLDPEKRYLVVDDICDGGGTFILLAEEARVPQENLHLYVSHGVFSKDAHYRLTARHYGRILTTNSFRGDYPGPQQVLRSHHTIDVVRPLLDAIPADLGTDEETATASVPQHSIVVSNSFAYSNPSVATRNFVDTYWHGGL